MEAHFFSQKVGGFCGGTGRERGKGVFFPSLRKYGYKEITPYLREVDWDREANDLWIDWWKAFQGCTSEKMDAFVADLEELYKTDPNLPKEPHDFLTRYARGFHGPRGNSVGAQSSRSKFHYAYCSTSNLKHYGCHKCDFYWGQFRYYDIFLFSQKVGCSCGRTVENIFLIFDI